MDDQIIESLRLLDGSTRSAVKLLTGATDEDTDVLGGCDG